MSGPTFGRPLCVEAGGVASAILSRGPCQLVFLEGRQTDASNRYAMLFDTASGAPQPGDSPLSVLPCAYPGLFQANEDTLGPHGLRFLNGCTLALSTNAEYYEPSAPALFGVEAWTLPLADYPTPPPILWQCATGSGTGTITIPAGLSVDNIDARSLAPTGSVQIGAAGAPLRLNGSSNVPAAWGRNFRPYQLIGPLAVNYTDLSAIVVGYGDFGIQPGAFA